MEEDLDKVAQGEAVWTELVGKFYEPFKQNSIALRKKYQNKKFTKKQRSLPQMRGSHAFI